MKRTHRVDLDLEIFYTNFNVNRVMKDIFIDSAHFVLDSRRTIVVLLTKIAVIFAEMKYFNLKSGVTDYVQFEWAKIRIIRMKSSNSNDMLYKCKNDVFYSIKKRW